MRNHCSAMKDHSAEMRNSSFWDEKSLRRDEESNWGDQNTVQTTRNHHLEMRNWTRETRKEKWPAQERERSWVVSVSALLDLHNLADLVYPVRR